MERRERGQERRRERAWREIREPEEQRERVRNGERKRGEKRAGRRGGRERKRGREKGREGGKERRREESREQRHKDGGSGKGKTSSSGAKSFPPGTSGTSKSLQRPRREGIISVFQRRKWRLRGTFWSPPGGAEPRKALKSADWL